LEIFLESNPPMPQDKALSWLLFGKTQENLSWFQLVQLADSARRLSGRGIGFNPLMMGKKLLKVDTFNIKTDENNPSSNAISVGKYISDKVYLEFEGSQQNPAKARVELQVSPKLSVDSSVNAEGQNAVGLNWHMDY